MRRSWKGARFHTAAEALEVPAVLPGTPRLERLDNGLTVCLLENRQAPIVTSALFYRAGTRDEAPGHGGTAHFLEHMMFKGSAHFGPGEIDRRTQALGGVNNAFTSHDTTAYYFNFAADRWTEALTIEADRMAALTLDPEQVTSERQVIVEEIAMYESEPWDALELEVQAKLFRNHPYGRPVLGTREDLMATGPEELRTFHRRLYRPDNALLIVVGDLDGGALDAIDRILGGLPAGAEPHTRSTPPPSLPESLVRIERRKGEVARLMLALPAPAGSHPDHPALRLITLLLAGGRTSRLHRALVDEGQLCAWISADLSETMDASQVTIGAEVVPGIEPARVEAEVLRVLDDFLRDPPSEEEIDRAKQIATADWVFGHERVHQQAISVGMAMTLFDLDHLDRHLRGLLATGRERIQEVASRYLRPERSAVLGWSLPRAES